MRAGFRKLLAVVDIVIVFAMIGYTLIVLKDWRIEYINPPDEKNQIPLWIAIFFHGTTPTAYSPSPDVNLAVFLRFDGTLTAGKGVHVNAFGNATSAATVNNEQIQLIVISFWVSLAFPAHNDSHGVPISIALALNRVSNQSNEFRDQASGIDIYWPIPGDFAPIITFQTQHYASQSEPSSLYAVHVEPASVAMSEKFNRVTQGLTIVLTAFAFVEAISLASENLKEEKPSGQTNPTQDQSQSAKHSQPKHTPTEKQN